MTDEQKQRMRQLVSFQLDASAKDGAERVKNQLALAQEALKALLLANGGAMVALFTFIGNLVAKAPAARFDSHTLRWAFAMFVAGFVADLVAYVLAFLSQDRFFQQAMAEVDRLTRSTVNDEWISDQTRELRLLQWGMGYYAAGIVCAVASVALFAVGCGFALSGVLL